MEPSAVVTSDYEIAGADEIQQFLVNAYSTSIRTRSDDRPHRLHHHRTDAGSVAMESAGADAATTRLKRLLLQCHHALLLRFGQGRSGKAEARCL